MFYATLMKDGFIHVEDTIPEGTVIQFQVSPEEALILRNALDTELNKKKRLKKYMQFLSRFCKNWAGIGFISMLALNVLNFGVSLIFENWNELFWRFVILSLALIYLGIGETYERYTKNRLRKSGII